MMSEALSFVLQKTPFPKNPSFQFLADALKSCASTSNANLGRALHSNVIKQGYKSCQIVLKALLNMYAKCKAFEDCQKLFGEIEDRDTVIWNILLSGFANSRNHDHKVMELYNVLHATTKPSSVTLAIVLPVYTRSGMLGTGKRIHAYAVKSGVQLQTLVGNALVSMYAKCGFVMDASAIFHEIPDKDVVSYNSLIAGFSENKLLSDAFQVFRQMIDSDVVPNYATIVSIVPILAHVGSYKTGKEIHCYVLRRVELENETMVVNALLSFYLRIRRIKEAQYLFSRMKFRDLVTWNSVIAGYATNGEWLKALMTVREFIGLNVFELDSVTLVSILPICAHLHNLQLGKEVHGYVFRQAVLFDDTSVGNALINFYAKCGSIEAAFRTFLLIPQRDLISWNSLLDAFGGNLNETDFCDLFHRMLMEGIKPDRITILTVLQFCATLAKVKHVKETHGFALKSDVLLNSDEPTVGNALIDAYAKCTSLGYASKVFECMSEKRNVVTYNSIIAGYLGSGSYSEANIIFRSMSERDLSTWNLMVHGHAQNECPSEALSFFHELQAHGLKPDAMTIMSILPVCGQMASGHLLRQCHGYAVRSCFDDIHLNAAILDVYSKCGSIKSACNLYASIPRKDLVVFTAMLGGYALHGMGKEAIQVFHHMLENGLKPDHVVLTAVLSACRHSGLVNDGLTIFISIEKPNMEQYACAIDLLARTGRIKEAFSFLNQMPVAANSNIWGTLLGACKTHHDVDIGRFVADQILKSETSDIGNFVVLSNLYAADDRWDGVMEMRRLMKRKEFKKPAGCSWIEVGSTKNVFVAGDYFHPDRSVIYDMLSNLDKQIKRVDKFQTYESQDKQSILCRSPQLHTV